MKKFLLRTSLFIASFLAIVLGTCLLANWKVARHTFEIHQVESNLMVLDSNQSWDLVILGISHARNFSRRANHAITEETLGKQIFNLGRGNALCGVYLQSLYLDYFYHLGNRADTAFIFMAPPLYFSAYLDQSSKAFWDEPLDWGWLLFYLQSEAPAKQEQVLHYFLNKLKPSWLFFKPYPDTPITDTLSGIDSAAMEAGFKLAYLDGITDSVGARNLEILRKMVRTCRQHQTEPILIIPPALFGAWPGHERMMAALRQMGGEENVRVLDYSDSIHRPGFYYDQHHLNSKGIAYFAGHFLKKISFPE